MLKLLLVLDEMYAEAVKSPDSRSVRDPMISNRIEFIALCDSNRAGVRLVMSCMLAKIENPKIDPREPITEIGSETCFSGRTYDEHYLTAYIAKFHLPCNSTTAFLTPALRNMTRPFSVHAIPSGRPPELYEHAFRLLDDVATNKVSARNVFLDTLRHLIVLRDQHAAELKLLLGTRREVKTKLAPSSAEIADLLEQHLRFKYSARLPVLGVAAAYRAVSALIGELALPLKGHNSADAQTGAFGDVEITLVNDEDIVTVYEMKQKAVSRNDIDHAVKKIMGADAKVDNYMIITTNPIADDVSKYARQMYETTQGTEVAVLDYLGFVRHFLHFFHRYRGEFLDAYRDLVLAEPASAVPHTLKMGLLALLRDLDSVEETSEQ